jgi:acetoin utilization deacetylase AcuC-like enzyme
MKVIFSPKCLEYDTPGHPESSERVRSTYGCLKKSDGFEFVIPAPCSRQDLLLVHSPKLIDEVKHGKFFNPETPSLPNIYEYAKLSAGGALLAMELALRGEKAFSLMRPPGHHAGKATFEGFCYFNNIAIAVAKALKKVRKIAILDIDCHFGQGTQEIFFGSKRVLCVSLHQHGIYPGGGDHSEKNCINYPMDAGIEEMSYLGKLEAAIEKIKEFNPNLLAISAGFDTYKEDPLTNMNLEVNSYSKIVEIINEIEKPKFAVLEGGYNNKLPLCVYEFLKKF